MSNLTIILSDLLRNFTSIVSAISLMSFIFKNNPFAALYLAGFILSVVALICFHLFFQDFKKDYPVLSIFIYGSLYVVAFVFMYLLLHACSITVFSRLFCENQPESSGRSNAQEGNNQPSGSNNTQEGNNQPSGSNNTEYNRNRPLGGDRMRDVWTYEPWRVRNFKRIYTTLRTLAQSDMDELIRERDEARDRGEDIGEEREQREKQIGWAASMIQDCDFTINQCSIALDDPSTSNTARQ